MKKIFTLLTLLVTFVGGVSADEVESPYTISWANKADVPAIDATSIESGGVTWTFSTNASSHEKNDRGIKIFGPKDDFNLEMSFSTSAFAELGPVKKIIVNVGRNSGSFLKNLTIEAKVNGTSYGTTNLTEKGNKDYEFTPEEAQEGNVEISVMDSGMEKLDQVYFGYITIYFGNEEIIYAPTFTPAGCNFNDEITVALATETQDATIQYSMDNGSTWTTYDDNEKITISETSTIQAKTVKGENESEIVSETYTKNIPLTAVTNKTWDFSTWEKATYKMLTVNDNLQVGASSEKAVTLDGTYLKFGGGGAATGRYVHFIVAGNCCIMVGAKHASSSGDDRPLKISFGSFGEEEETMGTLTAGGSVKDIVYAYDGNEQKDIYIYSGNSGINLTYIKVVSTVELATGKTYTTYVGGTALDFSQVADLTAYIVKSDGIGESSVTLTEIEKVPANTGIIIKSANPGTSYDVPVATNATEITDNLMTGSATATTHIEKGGGYILQDGEFYLSEEGDLPIGKAYLKIPASAAKLSINFAEGTGINNVNNNENESGKIFNLAGQQMKSAVKGVYIKNGKKYIK